MEGVVLDNGREATAFLRAMYLTLLRLAKEIQFRSGPFRRYFFHRFTYNVTAPELCCLCACLERTKDVPGCVVEVGVASGSTTVFLAKYLQAQGIERRIVCVDTFSGFVPSDIDYEVARRAKDRALYSDAFRVNSKRWFDGTMELNGLANVVRSFRADATSFDFASLGPIAFAFLDVDLYLVTRSAASGIYDALSPGGILAVHDCGRPGDRYDGAGQAYQELCAERSLPMRIDVGSVGIAEKPL